MDNSELVQQFKNAMRVLHDLCEAQPECDETCPYNAMCYTIYDRPDNWNVDREEEEDGTENED